MPRKLIRPDFTGPDHVDPVKSVVEGDNHELIAEVARLYVRPIDSVLDLTYGQGLWWKSFRPKYLVTNDLFVPGADYAEDYRLVGRERLSGPFDIVVFDPPYISTGGEPTVADVAERNATYGLGRAHGWKDIFADVGMGMTQAAAMARPGGLVWVKCCDFVESGAKRWGHDFVVSWGIKEVGLTKLDEFVHYSGTGPQPLLNPDGTPRRQVHVRSAHSFLVVFKVPGRR